MSKAGPEMAARRQFGSRVRALRKAAGLSQERLAQVSGLDRSYTGAIERGETNISLDNIVALARAIGVPLWMLFTLDETASDPQPPNPS